MLWFSISCSNNSWYYLHHEDFLICTLHEWCDALQLRGPEISEDLLLRTNGLDVCRCLMFQNLAEIIAPSINKVVDFAKKVPGVLSIRIYLHLIAFLNAGILLSWHLKWFSFGFTWCSVLHESVCSVSNVNKCSACNTERTGLSLVRDSYYVGTLSKFYAHCSQLLSAMVCCMVLWTFELWKEDIHQMQLYCIVSDTVVLYCIRYSCVVLY